MCSKTQKSASASEKACLGNFSCWTGNFLWNVSHHLQSFGPTWGKAWNSRIATSTIIFFVSASNHDTLHRLLKAIVRNGDMLNNSSSQFCIYKQCLNMSSYDSHLFERLTDMYHKQFLSKKHQKAPHQKPPSNCKSSRPPQSSAGWASPNIPVPGARPLKSKGWRRWQATLTTAERKGDLEPQRGTSRYAGKGRCLQNGTKIVENYANITKYHILRNIWIHLSIYSICLILSIYSHMPDIIWIIYLSLGLWICVTYVWPSKWPAHLSPRASPWSTRGPPRWRWRWSRWSRWTCPRPRAWWDKMGTKSDQTIFGNKLLFIFGETNIWWLFLF